MRPRQNYQHEPFGWEHLYTLINLGSSPTRLAPNDLLALTWNDKIKQGESQDSVNIDTITETRMKGWITEIGYSRLPNTI